MTRIFVAGHKGMVGSALHRNLLGKGYEVITRTKQELNLLNQADVLNFFRSEKIDYVFIAAARVGGIHANNTYRGQFIYENLTIQNNLIHSAWETGVKNLMFIGSSCIYPRDCPQPIKEEYLLTSALEHTNEPYAIAKIAGLKMCESYNRQYGTNYVCVMPTSLYGVGDNYHLNNSHVMPALIRKVHEAKINNNPEIVIWGSGKPYREFLYVDDMADSCVFLMENSITDGVFNIGSGTDLTILDLYKTICKVIGYHGQIVFDPSKPDGTPKKLLDISKITNLGWQPKISLEQGIKLAYADMLTKTLD